MNDNVDLLQSSAAEFGLDPSFITDVISKYGPEVLSLLVEAMRMGLSKEFVTELLTKLGPVLLQLLINVLTKSRMQLATPGVVVPGQVVVGDETSILMVLLEKYFPLFIEKYLPILMQKYGDQIMQLIMNAILNKTV